MKFGERFTAKIDFRQTPVVAIDELFQWDQRDTPRVIRDLERQALIQQGRLILVVQDKKELMQSGYELARQPAHIELCSAGYHPADLQRLPPMRAQNA